jgi:glycine/D-amino acid oxidase-like deaminating enzyme
MNQSADVVICGAGITGVAAAHFLSKAQERATLNKV